MSANDDTIEYRGYAIHIIPDDDPCDPREWDNIGQMVFFHRRMILGDNHNLTVEQLNKELATGDYIYLPVRAYEHSGITITADPIRAMGYPFSDIWDAGTLGVIRVHKDKIRDNYNCKRISKRILNRVYSCLQSEVETYNSYLTGDVYGYSINELDDSVWGFYGHNWKENGLLDEAQGTIDYYLKNIVEDAWQHNQSLEAAVFSE